VSDDQREVFEPDVIDDYDPSTPIAPQDVASAARSCQAIILIMLFLALVACVVVAVAVLG
jgi:hypothetical protein